MNSETQLKRCSVCNLPKTGDAYFLNSNVCTRCVDAKFNNEPVNNVIPILTKTHTVASVDDQQASQLSQMYSRLIEKDADVKPVRFTPKENTVMPKRGKRAESKAVREQRGEDLKAIRAELGWTRAEATKKLKLPESKLNNDERACSQDIFDMLIRLYAPFRGKATEQQAKTLGAKPGPLKVTNYRQTQIEAYEVNESRQINESEKQNLKALVKQLDLSVHDAALHIGLPKSSIANDIGHGCTLKKYKNTVQLLEQAILDEQRKQEAMPGGIQKIQQQQKADIQTPPKVVEVEVARPKQQQMALPAAATTEGNAYRKFALGILMQVQELISDLPGKE